MRLKVTNIFAAVSNKTILDPLLEILDSKSIQFWGTEGTVGYLRSKGFSAQSVVHGFDFDGRVKSLDRVIFARLLADRSNLKHLKELKKLKLARNTSEVKPGRLQENTSEVRDFAPFDLVMVDLYPPDPNNFPESMDIGGQALIRAAVKNYQNVALAFDQKSITDLSVEIKKNSGVTTLSFRKNQASKALKFIAARCVIEAKMFDP